MKKRLGRTFSSRVVLLLLAALVFSHANGFLVFSLSRNNSFENRAEDRLINRFRRVARLVNESPENLHETILQAASTHRHSFHLDPTQPWGNSVSSSLETRLAQRLKEGRGEALETAFVRIKTTDDVLLSPGPRSKGHQGTVRTYEVVAQLRDGQWLSAMLRVPLSRFGWPWQVLLSLALMGVITAVITGRLVRQITRPVSALAAAAEKLGRGDHPDTLPEKGPAEFRTLNNAFNTMNRRLNRSMTERMHILAAISHDLRTPITSLLLQAELIEDDEARARMVRTLGEMQKITEETLTFMREEALSGELEEADLVQLVNEVSDEFDLLGQRIHRPTQAPIRIHCRPESVKRILHNLLQNALSYGTNCEIRYEEHPRKYHLIVRNDGAPLSLDALHQMLQPFVRLESSRSRETGGTGLGLPIARSLARGQGGDLSLLGRPKGGLDAVLSLPKADQ